MISFTIPGTPITKKNSQRILINSKTGKPFVKPSAAYERYQKDAGWSIPKTWVPIDYRVNIKYLFYMPDDRRVDIANLVNSLDDILVRYGLLKDDNYKIVAAHDGTRVLIDRKAPRTEVEVEAL